MDILFVSHLLNSLLMIGIPIALAVALLRIWKLPARVWWIGAATFIISQVGHIPFNLIAGKLFNQSTVIISWNPTNQLIFNSIFAGLSAGLFEECARYIVLRWWLKDARSWRSGILFGAGHGGAEAIILGAITLYSFIQLALLRYADLTAIFPASQLSQAQQQVHTYWSLSWYASLLGALERFFTIPAQIALAVMVMQVFLRKNIVWLFAAIGYHALLDAVAVFGQVHLNPYQLEGVIGLSAVLSIGIIFLLRSPHGTEIEKDSVDNGRSKTDLLPGAGNDEEIGHESRQ
jgi:uncharacterized membrane protein YhfC